jgi:hypothetical protein
MGRVVTVNASRGSTARSTVPSTVQSREFGIDSPGEFGVGSITQPNDYGIGSVARPNDFGVGTIVEGDNYGRDFGIPTAPPVGMPAKGADQGPCLYFGPRGQRCDRRATNAGFCAVHQPNGVTASGIPKPSKKFIASLLAIAAVVWPYLADIVKEVIRWIHAH